MPKRDRFLYILEISAGVLLAAAVAVLCILLIKSNRQVPSITLNGNDIIHLEVFDRYEDPGAVAVLGNRDITEEILIYDNVNTKIPGEYEVNYTVEYKGKNYIRKRLVTVSDLTPPLLTLEGESVITVSAREQYTEPGFRARDNFDGDITPNVTIRYESCDAGFTVIYSVADSSGNETQKVRQGLIQDTEAPVLTLKGSRTITIEYNGTYQEPGFTAFDNADGDLTDRVQISGNVNPAVAGIYIIEYTVTDDSGNTAVQQRQVTVKRSQEVPSGQNRVYLTFDDGPSAAVTTRILDILAKNNIKATFFIVNFSDSDARLIQRMAEEGHTIAIHGYSHDYAKIYVSEEAFMENVTALREKIYALTGVDSVILRFPGGSSNTVSKNYNEGIMSRLTKLVEEQGYTYFDWNVSSGDAAAKKASAAQIAANVKNGLKKGRNNVVLMHDAATKTTTADALQEIIDYGKANGYTFLPITEETPAIHHSVNN